MQIYAILIVYLILQLDTNGHPAGVEFCPLAARAVPYLEM
jgi:hypothetical protein